MQDDSRRIDGCCALARGFATGRRGGDDRGVHDLDRAGADFRWQFVEADAAERAAFVDAAAVVRLAETDPVAVPNRLRAVHRVFGADGRRYFLKSFRAIQPKNLLRDLLTAPRARTDAEREARVAAALRAAGFAAPRPVAVGRSGRASLLLLAELPGEPLARRIAAGRCPPALADRVADHCGLLWRSGFALPDLSADHVFVDGDDPATARLGVLDLHDGRLGRAGPRTLRRCLRRFLRSVRDLPTAVPRPRALRFALRLARAAGLGGAARAAVEGLPPLDTHGRYDHGDRAGRYAVRPARRARAESALLARIWPGRAGDRVLDAPCGAGRLRPPLEALGARWHGADRSRAMLETARASGASPLCQADARTLPCADRSFDGVVVFRFLHHLQTDAAREVAREAARVADRFVVLSHFHPLSAHHLRRLLTRWVTGRGATRFAVGGRTVDRWMDAVGFEPVARASQRPFLRDLRLVAYERRRR
jgi:SAM-dependent methyltransferase